MMSRDVVTWQEEARAETQRRKGKKSLLDVPSALLLFFSSSLLLCAFASLREISFSYVIYATWHHLIDIMRRPHPQRIRMKRQPTPIEQAPRFQQSR
ncbi:hypothetical protein CKO42_10005 [Lamprobacter modestohalophilus]|uniref:Uncharacterized protein n=1 Tax=Lamprobacter modestohalophilus TaxID=1064514 RepID=A0A9X0W866_9GAMM|nr:hypothetical protein [Lamprobacter modestohalophilus]MBK1618760.1 hypothetical protein [Lamprobacter modestohalophilus]